MSSIETAKKMLEKSNKLVLSKKTDNEKGSNILNELQILIKKFNLEIDLLSRKSLEYNEIIKLLNESQVTCLNEKECIDKKIQDLKSELESMIIGVSKTPINTNASAVEDTAPKSYASVVGVNVVEEQQKQAPVVSDNYGKLLYDEVDRKEYIHLLLNKKKTTIDLLEYSNEKTNNGGKQSSSFTYSFDCKNGNGCNRPDCKFFHEGIDMKRHVDPYLLTKILTRHEDLDISAGSAKSLIRSAIGILLNEYVNTYSS